jgi:hypothetical protein
MTPSFRRALALGLVLLTGAALAQSTYQPIGRRKHAAVMLRDGTVMVFGGAADNGFNTPVVESFTPGSGWERDTDLSTPVASSIDVRPLATLLPDGRVLVVSNGTFTWTPGIGWADLRSAAPMPQPLRDGATMTLLQDGRVLLVGGIDTVNGDAGFPLIGQLGAAATNWQWREIPDAGSGPMRRGHTATLLKDGRVLIAGGGTPGTGSGVSETSIFDPVTGGFSSGGSLSADFIEATSTRRLGGDVAIFGSLNSNTLPLMLINAPPLVSFSAVGRPAGLVTMGAHAAVLVPNGTVVLTGGFNSTSNTLDTVAALGPDGGFRLIAPMEGTRAYHTATTLMDGRVLIVGGQDAGAINAFTGAGWEIIDPIGFTFDRTLNGFPGRSEATVTLTSTGYALVVGGAAPPNVVGKMAATSVGGFTAFNAPGFGARAMHTATLLNSDQVLVLGGKAGDGAPLNECWLLHIGGPSLWKPCAPMPQGVYAHTATLLADGRVLVTGGLVAGGAPTANAYLFDPRTPNGGTWTPTVMPLSIPRAGHAAVLTRQNQVLIVGGAGTNTSTDLFLPSTQSFGTGPTLNQGRSLATASLLNDGRVLVAGGVSGDGGSVQSLELLDGNGSAFTVSPVPFSEPRTRHGAIVQPTGNVVFGGGAPGFGGVAERFDPLANHITNSAPLGTPRINSAMVLNDTGEILIIGGDGSGNLRSEVNRVTLEAPEGLSHQLKSTTSTVAPAGAFSFALLNHWREGSEASSGGGQSSSVALPRLVFQRLDNGLVLRPTNYTLDLDAGTIVGTAPLGLIEGPWRAWAYVSGYPGQAAWFHVGSANTSAFDAGLPDGGAFDGGATDGGSGDGGTNTDGGNVTDGGSGGFGVSAAFEVKNPYYTRVALLTTVSLHAPPGTPSSELKVWVDAKADLERADGQPWPLLLPVPNGTVGPIDVALPQFAVRPAQDGDHTLNVSLDHNGVEVARGQAVFTSISADGTLEQRVCGCGAAPGGMMSLLLLALLRKARPKR